MSSFKKISVVNKEYARLLRDVLERDDVLSAKRVDLGEVFEKCTDDSGIKVPSIYGELTAFQYKMSQIIEDFEDFWASNRAAYLQELRVSPGYNIHMSPGVDPVQLLYFDTIVTCDPICGYPSASAADALFWLVISLRGLRPLIPLLEVDSDYPLVAIFSREITEKRATQLFNGRRGIWDPVIEYGKRIADSFLQSIAKYPDDYKTRKQWMELGENQDQVDLDEKLYVEKLREYFIEDPSISFKGTYEDIRSVIRGESTALSGNSLKHLVTLITSGFCQIAQDEVVASSTLSDNFLNLPGAYQTKLHIEGKEALNEYGLTEEEIAAKCLELPPFRSLQLHVDDIISFRTGGGLEMLRTTFRNQRKLIKFAKMEKLDSVIKAVTLELKERIEEHNSEVEDLEIRLSRIPNEVKKDSYKLGGLLALNILSVPFPLLAVVTIPGSVIYGGPTVLELLKKRKEAKSIRRKLEEMGARPVCLFKSLKRKYKKGRT